MVKAQRTHIPKSEINVEPAKWKGKWSILPPNKKEKEKKRTDMCWDLKQMSNLLV